MNDSFCDAKLITPPFPDKHGKYKEKASEFSLEYKYLDQQYVRCSQDIIEKGCTFTKTSQDSSEYSSIAKLLTVTTGSLPFSLVANTLFDWPVNLSPSMHAYREGMGVAYAMHPTNPSVFIASKKSQVCTEKTKLPLKQSFSNCALVKNAGDYGGEKVVLDPQKTQTFSDLERLYTENPAAPPPVWMLNATAAPSRSMYGWASRNQTDMHRYTFSMTPFKQGAFQYGDISLDQNNIDLLTATSTSAAFLDANQTVVGQPWRSVVGAGQHLVNLSWGIDLPHPNASIARLTTRSFLPFPLYYADYWVYKQPAYVRLLDGGSSDNLGAYRLIVDGFKDVIISDHAQDTDGRMGDLCLLRNELKIRHGLYLHMPGLEGWPNPCMAVVNRSMEENRRVRNLFAKMPKHKLDDKYYYPIHAWPYPFLVGCVSKINDKDSCSNDNDNIQRIWLIKPAMDFTFFHNKQINRKVGLVNNCIEDIKNIESYFYLPCETSGFIINNFTEKNKYGFTKFPQNGTVFMTIDSSSTLYGAYRDLAKSYTTKVLDTLEEVKKNPQLFATLLKLQHKHKIRNYINDKEQFLHHDSDITHDDWKLEIRDKARNAFFDAIPHREKDKDD